MGSVSRPQAEGAGWFRASAPPRLRVRSSPCRSRSHPFEGAFRDATRRIPGALGSHGVEMLDAPVSGGSPEILAAGTAVA